MEIKSKAFENEGVIPVKYTKDGEWTNPPFNITVLPDEAVSLAIIMDDIDVPREINKDGLWNHWIVWNIPITSDAVELFEGEISGTEGLSTGGEYGYEPPAPPKGEHRYIFRFYVLNSNLDLDRESTRLELISAIQKHLLEEGEYIGKYSRNV